MLDPKRRLGAGLFLAFWGTVLVSSWPKRFSPAAAHGIQDAAGAVLARMTLGATSAMNLFQNPTRRLAVCVFSLGLRGDGTSRLLYATPLEYCQGSRVRWFDDPYPMAIYRIPEFPSSVCQRSREETQARLGELFCRKSGGSMSRVMVGFFVKTMADPQGASDKGAPRWELRTMASYDCKAGSPAAVSGEEITRMLRRNYPDYFGRFKI